MADSTAGLVTARTPQGSIAWAFSLVTLPDVSVPLYWVLGRNSFNGYVEALREKRIEKREAVEAMFDGIREKSAPIDAEAQPELAVLERLGPFPFTRGNDVALLVDGEATFRAIFEAIELTGRGLLFRAAVNAARLFEPIL